MSCPSVDNLASANPATTSLIESRKKQGQVSARLTSLRNTWIPLQEIPELLQKTVVVAEDASFYGHEGIDWHEVREAFQKNIESAHVVRGASTITQQLAKNLFLSEERTLLRKIREWIIAGKLERTLNKRRILELYVNCIEFGRGIFGIGPASLAYFGKRPGELQLDEMVRLVAVIPEPLILTPTKATERLKRRSQIILDRLLRFNYITEEDFQNTNQVFSSFFNGNVTVLKSTKNTDLKSASN